MAISRQFNSKLLNCREYRPKTRQFIFQIFSTMDYTGRACPSLPIKGTIGPISWRQFQWHPSIWRDARLKGSFAGIPPCRVFGLNKEGRCTNCTSVAGYRCTASFLLVKSTESTRRWVYSSSHLIRMGEKKQPSSNSSH